jgi:hypothetical protein
MNNQYSQNLESEIRRDLDECNYNYSMKDHLANMIIKVMNYPKTKRKARHFVKTIDIDKIICVNYFMSVPFNNRNLDVPLQILFIKNIPEEAPKVFLDLIEGTAPNPKNPDIDVNSKQIKTTTLKNWNQYSNIENAMNEIYNSFGNVFPVYKTSTKSSQSSIYGGKQNQNSLNQPYKGSFYVNENINRNDRFYKAPTTSIYSSRMTNDQNKGNDNSFGGGLLYNSNNNFFSSKDNDIKKELNDEKIRNKKLVEELNQLKRDLELERDKNKTISRANEELLIATHKTIDELNTKIDSLVLNLKEKDEELVKLKKELINLNNEKSTNENDNIMAISFTTDGFKFIHALPCRNTDMFFKLEEKLYEAYPQYRERDNYFTVDGKKIQRFKTFYENGIKCSDVIQLHELEKIE